MCRRRVPCTEEIDTIRSLLELPGIAVIERREMGRAA